MHETPPRNPSDGTVGDPPASPRAPRRRFPRAALVTLGLATVALLLVVAGFVRLTGLVGAIQGLSTPAAITPAIGRIGDDTGVAPAPAMDAAPAEAGAAGDTRPSEPRPGAPAGAAGSVATSEDRPALPPRRQASTPAAGEDEPDRSGPGWLDGFADDAGQTVAGIASAAGLNDAQLRPLTILLMGVDARAGEAIDVGVRPDALALLRLDPATGACRMLAVPRDTRTELPGYGLTKVNHALAVGGVPLQRRVVEQLVGLDIDRFVLIDLRALEEVVGIVGGVTLDVPEAFVAADGTPIDAGRQTLDGPQVLAYVQYRGGPDGDLGRIRRQQQVLRALLAKASDLEVLPTVAGLLPVLEDHLRTDLTPAEIVGLAQRFRSSCTPDSLSVAMLDGTTATFNDPLVHQSLSYVVIDEAEIAREREQFLTGAADER